MNKKRLIALIVISSILLVCIGSALVAYILQRQESSQVNNADGTEEFDDPNAFEWDVIS